ncbi:DUF3108 domain-containing protein [Fundidesulfovibrio terrae]|uniref:DUF3108 domain-containing protein n=1 Tax=Fundidesulfovibrio terrae TaxID=2922866 RepID=UPI001FAFE97E|nr:DUF3108 domain-containing protein [Fundidesulfovibrio terrae]
MTSPRLIPALLALALLAACAPRTAPVAQMPMAQAPQWKPGDYWVFNTKTRSPFTMAERMEVAQVGDEIVLTGNGDPTRKVRLDKDFCVKESQGTLLRYSVASGQDAYIFFPLAVGESRTFQQSTALAKGTQNYVNTVMVEAAEEITVSAGTFKTFRIRVSKRNETGWSGTYMMWYAPDVGYFVRVVDTQNNIAELVKYGKK